MANGCVLTENETNQKQRLWSGKC